MTVLTDFRGSRTKGMPGEPFGRTERSNIQTLIPRVH
jgi:hypothetical protein